MYKIVYTDENTNETMEAEYETKEQAEEALANEQIAHVDTEEKSSEEYTPLPTPLVNLRLKNYGIGILLIIFVLGFAFAEREWKLCSCCLFGVWFIYNGYIIEKKFREGKIVEKFLICTSAHPSTLRKSIRVGFRTDDEYPVFYEYEVGGRGRIDDFHPNGMYVIYYDKDTPSQLLAYTEI